MSQNLRQAGSLLTIAQASLVHPTHTDGFVHSADPVVVGQIVGVAETSATAAGDNVAIATRGVFNLSAVATNQGGNSAIALGDQLYIDGATAVISKDSTKTKFGVALGAVTSGATANVDIKLG